MCQSEWARRHGIIITPTPHVLLHMHALVHKVLDPLREEVGPIQVLSGYRPPQVNTGVGGAKSSQHVLGEAADIRSNALSSREIFDTIRRLDLPFDQVIEEFGQWVHVSYGDRNRRQALEASKVNGKTAYKVV